MDTVSRLGGAPDRQPCH